MSRYKQLVALEHPDKHPGDPLAKQNFQAISTAYQELIGKSEDYDSTRDNDSGASEDDFENRSPWITIFGKLGISIQDLQSLQGSLETLLLIPMALLIILWVGVQVFALISTAVDSSPDVSDNPYFS
eukprot:TRINITY_DN34704_c0_g1_i2.p1 TRINITY_DN34704_c0_g1~~TRINITY_DN34704_c0_g1_i2.p1  ORF type:complete len:127 (+),score=9.67 TRINITY_DN34704_c0_g1_i2:203-583(+)